VPRADNLSSIICSPYFRFLAFQILSGECVRDRHSLCIHFSDEDTPSNTKGTAVDILERILSARATGFRVRLEIASQLIAQSTATDAFARTEVSDPHTMVLVAHEHLYKLSAATRRYATTMEDVAIGVGNPDLLSGIFRNGAVVPLANVEQITCISANNHLVLRYEEDEAEQVLHIEEFGGLEFDKLWNSLRVKFQPKCTQTEERASVVHALIATPLMLLCVPAAIGIGVLSWLCGDPKIMWLSLGFLLVAVLNTAVRLLRWPLKTTLVPIASIAHETNRQAAASSPSKVFRCRCGAKLSMNQHLSGKTCKCPKCERLISIPHFNSPNDQPPRPDFSEISQLLT
jgi:hypothetical protein